MEPRPCITIEDAMAYIATMSDFKSKENRHEVIGTSFLSLVFQKVELSG